MDNVIDKTWTMSLTTPRTTLAMLGITSIRTMTLTKGGKQKDLVGCYMNDKCPQELESQTRDMVISK